MICYMFLQQACTHKHTRPPTHIYAHVKVFSPNTYTVLITKAKNTGITHQQQNNNPRVFITGSNIMSTHSIPKTCEQLIS